MKAATFGKELEGAVDALKLDPNPRVVNSRDLRRKAYQRGLNAALDAIVQIEGLARMDGFDVKVGVGSGNAEPTPSILDGTISFVQSYGVIVTERE